jgi:hypothetical protein
LYSFVSALEQSAALILAAHGDDNTDNGADEWRIAVVGEEVVAIFDAQTGRKLVHEKLEESAHMNVRFTPGGRYFIQCDMNGRGTGLGVRIWDGQHQTLLQEIPGNIGSSAVSRDSKYLAVGGTLRTTIWQFK